MKSILLSTLAVLALSTASMAETFEFPSEAPIARATYPDTWKAEESVDGLQGFSADDEVALYVEPTTTADSQANVNKALKFLADNGVKLDKASLTDSDSEINGRPVSTINVDGTDERGPVAIGIHFIGFTAEQIVMVISWTLKEEDGSVDEALQKDVASVINSVEPVAE